MADEKKQAVAEKEPKQGNKFVAWCKALPHRIATPFKNMWYELKKVTWPTKRKLIVYSGVVLVFMLVMGCVIGLIDMGASALIKWLGGLNA